MFGLSFGELLVVAVVGLVVLGPKELPKMLRKAGHWAGRLRRMALDLRTQSGIDDILRAEGISDDLREITKLARGELDGVVSAARVDTTGLGLSAAGSAAYGASQGGGASLPTHDPYHPPSDSTVVMRHDGNNVISEISRERENPLQGPDCYLAMPETAVVYAGFIPPSPLATDATYTAGIPTPPDPTIPPPMPDEAPADAAPAEAPGADPAVAPVEGDVAAASGGRDHFSVDAFAAESLPAALAADDDEARRLARGLLSSGAERAAAPAPVEGPAAVGPAAVEPAAAEPAAVEPAAAAAPSPSTPSSVSRSGTDTDEAPRSSAGGPTAHREETPP